MACRPTVLHAATAAFPLRHAFVDGDAGDPSNDWIRVAMGDFVEFIANSKELRYCPLRAPKSTPAGGLLAGAAWHARCGKQPRGAAA